MSKTREKKQTQVQSAGWVEGMIDLLRGSVLGLGIALAVLAVTAVLISVGVISNTKTHSAVIAACLLGGVLGGMHGVKRRGTAPLPTGLGVGGGLFLLLAAVGMLVYNTAPTLHSGGAIACACLCGGGLAGVLGSKSKKKRRK